MLLQFIFGHKLSCVVVDVTAVDKWGEEGHVVGGGVNCSCMGGGVNRLCGWRWWWCELQLRGWW